MWTFLKKIHIIFQNFPKNVINDLYKLCFQNYCASLIKVVMKRNNLNCIKHSKYPIASVYLYKHYVLYKNMLIFKEFFNTQPDQNILQNTPNCTTFSKFSQGS